MQMHEFFDWYEGRDVIEQVQVIKKQATEDFHLRIPETGKRAAAYSTGKSTTGSRTDRPASGICGSSGRKSNQ
ncbi:MAG: hypothetical protein V8T31_10910 [Lachnospiraceae bacterium]